MRFLFLSTLLLCARAGQEPKPATVLRYTVHDAGGKREKVDEFQVFAAEIREPGFDRFERHELSRLPCEYLFPQVPEGAKPGTKWTVESIPAADSLRYAGVFDPAAAPLFVRVAGTYEVAAPDKRGLRVVKGAFAITRMKFTPIDSPESQKKAGRRGELKPSNDAIGSLVVELKLRDDGILQEASYGYSIKVPDVRVFLKNSHVARETIAPGYDHRRTVALAEEREVERKAAREAAAKAVEPARKWLLTQQEADGGFWDLEQAGKGMRHSDWKDVPSSNVVRALRAAGMTPSDRPMQAALAFLRGTTWSGGGPPVVVGTIPLAYQAWTTERRRCESAGDDIRKSLSVADAQWMATTMKKLTDPKSTAHGLWPRIDGNSTPIHITMPEAGDIALSVHEAVLQGWDVPPEVWKRAIETLRTSAIEMAKGGRLEVELAPDNLYVPVLGRGEHRVVAWPQMPAVEASPLPAGFEATRGALMVLAVARLHLARAKQLDAGTVAVLDDLQRGGWAWVCANYRARWNERSAFVSDPAGGGGLDAVALAAAYGVRSIRGRDPVVEMSVRLCAESYAEGGWSIGWSRTFPMIAPTSAAVIALLEFTPPLWMKP